MRTTKILLTALLIILILLLFVACNKNNNYNTKTTTAETTSISPTIIPNTSNETDIDRNYNYTKCSYCILPSGAGVTVDIIAWKLDESGILEITLLDGSKRLIKGDWVLYE